MTLNSLIEPNPNDEFIASTCIAPMMYVKIIQGIKQL